MQTTSNTSRFTILGGTFGSFAALLSLATLFAPEIMMAM